MRVRWPLFAAFLMLGLSYVAYPYITLYRIGIAIRGADASTLEALVDWPSVREGIKEDICDLVIEDPGTNASGSGLPPFGASFMRGIASNTIDQAVTPQALLAATGPAHRAATPRAAPMGADVSVDWAFFESPTVFMVSLQTPGQPEPIKLEMDLQHGAWRINRVWLPAELLSNPPSKT